MSYHPYKRVQSAATVLSIGKPFLQPWKNSDAVIVVEEEKIHVHTSILSFASSVFERMFNSSFKESKTKQIEMTGKNYDDVLNVIRMLYPQQEVDLGEVFAGDGIAAMLEIAKEYMLDSLIKRIEDFVTVKLSSISLERGETKALMVIADRYNFNEAINKCAVLYRNFGWSPPGSKDTSFCDKTKTKLYANWAIGRLDALKNDLKTMYEQYLKLSTEHSSCQNRGNNSWNSHHMHTSSMRRMIDELCGHMSTMASNEFLKEFS